MQAQEAERKLISRELHDEVGQMLTALRMELRSLQDLRTSPGDQFSAHLEGAKRLTEQSLRALRDMAMGLRPSMLDDLGLGSAVQWQARQFSKAAGIPVNVQIDGRVSGLPEPHRTCIYRVIQEALTNCARHANAKQIDIAIAVDAAGISASIRDDGIGFDRASVRGRGLGLVGMQERVMELGGELTISSQKDGDRSFPREFRLPRRPSRVSIRILLADDHGVVRKGLRFLLEQQPEIEIVAEAADGREAVRIAEETAPDVVIMDIAMPLLNGIEATAQIVKRKPEIGVVILSMHSDEDYLLSALNAGAKGYLLKDSAEVDLVAPSRRCTAGRRSSVPRSPRPCSRTTFASCSSATSRTRMTCSPTARRRSCNCLPKENRTKRSRPFWM